MGYKLSKERLEQLHKFGEKYYDTHFSEINKNWKDEWQYVIQREYPWSSLRDLIQYKIMTIKTYMEALLNDELNPKYKISNRSIKRQIKEMNEILNLGEKIYEDNYQEDAMAWHESNTKTITKIYKITPFVKEYYKRKGIPGNFLPDGFECIGQLENNSNDSLISFIQDFGIDEWCGEKTPITKWCEENNIDRKSVGSISYSEWTNGKSDEENKEFWFKLLKDANKKRKKDIKKYYNLIAKYEDGWGD